jgi:hypothetical protein
MIGIYRIVNKNNNRSYIGQSINIKMRVNQHFRNAFNANTHTYNYPISRAIRKYPREDFEIETLETTTLENLTEREQYWINYYNTLENGYNQENAVDAKRGENCNLSILTQEQVNQIIDLIKNTNLLMSYIAEDFGVSGSAIEEINKGRSWVKDGIDYPIRKNAKSFSHQGEYQNTAVLTSEEVWSIRNRYVTESLPEIFEDYKEKISSSGFKKVCYGVTWKHIPCYRKREKIWVYPK